MSYTLAITFRIPEVRKSEGKRREMERVSEGGREERRCIPRIEDDRRDEEIVEDLGVEECPPL
eukprot:950182-Amorphochlora_amoeboformis.AAC.1